MPYLRLVNYSECRFQVTALHSNEVLNEDLFTCGEATQVNKWCISSSSSSSAKFKNLHQEV